jgi:hypothetical protein
MAALRDRLPHLDHFLDAYMHQDWRLFGDTLEAVVAAYAEDTSPGDVGALRSEIALLLAAFGNRVEPIYLALYPNGVLPSGWGMTVEQWLRRIAQLAASHSLEADQKVLF